MAETQAGYEAAIELTRGGIVECVHFGAMAVVDSTGNLLTSLGDPNLLTFPRSSMKPLQAIPFVEDGGPEHFGFTEEELAILCASHHGTDEHLRGANSLPPQLFWKAQRHARPSGIARLFQEHLLVHG